jgi:hypothetical protein
MWRGEAAARRAPTIALWALALLLAWGMARETRRVLTVVDHARHVELPPTEWRLGSPAVVELESFLRAASPWLAPRHRVLFLAPHGLGEASQLALLWSGYLRPEVQWILAQDVGLDVPVEIVVCWRNQLDDPRFEELFAGAHGRVYRRRQ